VDDVVMDVVDVVDEMDMVIVVNVVNVMNVMNGVSAVNVKTAVTYVTRRSNLVALCSISGQSTMDPSTHQHTPHCGSGGVRSGAARAALDGLKITGRGRRVHGSRAVGVLSVQCSGSAGGSISRDGW
jgi:hypothetical protein